MVSLAGATKDLVSRDEASANVILKQIDISYRLHAVKKIVIIQHMDCGAYGGHAGFDNFEAEKAKQIADMKKASEIIRGEHSDLEIEHILARIDESGDKPSIDFEIV